MCSSDIFLGLLAILFPPIAVWIKSGICTGDSLINILLCTLGYIPGLLHAWYIISLYPEPSDYEYSTIPEAERGNGDARVTYCYVASQPSGEALRQGPGGHGYGTTGAPAPKPQQQRQGRADGEGGQQGEGSSGAGEQAGGVPPSYEQATGFKGDHKVQT